MATGAKLKGAREMIGKLRNVITMFPYRVGQALWAEMEIELKEVVYRTPKDKGPLRESEHLIGPFDDGKTITVVIVAGGPTAPYAVIVHEDLDAFHSVGQAKYLESVIMESRAFMAQRLAKRLRLEEMV
jgi:hypothetical protein